MKKVRMFVVIGFVSAIVIAIVVFSLVSYLNWKAYYDQMMATLLALPKLF